MGYIINVPRGSPANEEYNQPFITSNSAIYYWYVGGKRTPELSKKRLSHCLKADLETALIRFLGSSENPRSHPGLIGTRHTLNISSTRLP